MSAAKNSPMMASIDTLMRVGPAVTEQTMWLRRSLAFRLATRA